MSSDHNNLATWAAKARAHGNDTIEIDVDMAERVSDMIVELTNKIAELEHNISNMDLVLQDKLNKTKLLRAYPGEEGFNFELAGGPVGLISEYFVQMMNHDPENPLNFIEMTLNPKHASGPMVISIQRINGKTPGELLDEAKETIKKLEAQIEQKDAYIRNHFPTQG